MMTKILLTLRLDSIRRERIQIYKTINTASWLPRAQYVAKKNRLKSLASQERAIEEVIGIID